LGAVASRPPSAPHRLLSLEQALKLGNNWRNIMKMKTILNLMGRAATPVVLVASMAMLSASFGCAWADAKLTGAGATFPYPLYSKWFDMYNKKTGVEINYQSIGSGGGIQQVKAGTVDFGASDAPLTNARLKEMPRNVIHFPTVAGAVVLAYNLPGLATPLRLTPEAITGIYMGKITMWNDKAIAGTNPGVALPGVPVLPVHRSDG